MRFDTSVTEKGVVERGFGLEVDGESVPGILWTPEGAAGTRPLVAIGHGGTQHKRVANVLSLARRLVRHLGYAVVAIDAPDHGDRVPADQQRASREERRRAMREMTPEQARERARRFAKASGEWKATLDAVRALDEVGEGPLGYWGVSMGTAIGVPMVAAEPRVNAAVFGLAGLGNRPGAEAFGRAAASITIPVLFLFQWEDELASHEAGIALFEAFGSADKTMHINPGPHVGIPLHERDSVELFYRRHLGTSEEAPTAETAAHA